MALPATYETLINLKLFDEALALKYVEPWQQHRENRGTQPFRIRHFHPPSPGRGSRHDGVNSKEYKAYWKTSLVALVGDTNNLKLEPCWFG